MMKNGNIIIIKTIAPAILIISILAFIMEDGKYVSKSS